jgi:hypothetical protein
MDGRKNNGGHKTNGGRPSKADEHKLIEKLSPLAPAAYKALKDSLQDGQGWAVKLFFEYLYGKPKQQIENTNINIEEKQITQKELQSIKDKFFKDY